MKAQERDNNQLKNYFSLERFNVIVEFVLISLSNKSTKLTHNFTTWIKLFDRRVVV